jgi:hypothetical protein
VIFRRLRDRFEPYEAQRGWAISTIAPDRDRQRWGATAYNVDHPETRGKRMSRHQLSLELPEEVYEHVRRAAKGMNQPVEKVLVNIVRGATPSLEKVPIEYRAELEAMEDFGDEELWRVSRSRPTPAKQRRLEELLDKNQRGELTDRERRALEELRTDGNRRMLRRTYAVVLLKYRGHRVPIIEAF